jgi:alkylated DNA repair protein (DNA oxidative demethylase)
MAPLVIRDVEIHKGFLPLAAQREMVDAVRRVVERAPLFSPMTPHGRPMSVRMTSAGMFGWHADRQGYRYLRAHPDGTPWPAIPAPVLAVWSALAPTAPDPECCLVNFYGADARMGMHQDRDEATFDWPVLSISLGDDALFRIGNITRGGKTESLWLSSGDVVVMGGAARLVHHGIDRIRPGTSRLLPQGGRLNLTLRVVSQR